MKLFISVLIALVTAGLSFIAGQITMREKIEADQRSAAYVQYVESRAIANSLKIARRELCADEKTSAGDSDSNDSFGAASSKCLDLSIKIEEQNGLFDAARFRIMLYGSAQVVEALWAYHVEGSDGAIQRLFFQMRREITDDTTISALDLEQLLNPSEFKQE